MNVTLNCLFQLISAEINMIHIKSVRTEIFFIVTASTQSHNGAGLPFVHGFITLQELKLLLVYGSSALPVERK